ncbi:MAG TPA: (Fe-S)-binding protein [Rariglobus sp.]
MNRRYLYVSLGQPADGASLKEAFRRSLRRSLHEFAEQVFGQQKLLKDRKSGVMHVIIFYGFMILQFGALDILLRGLFGVKLPVPAYPVFELLQETTVVLVLLAMGYATYRRYGERLTRLQRGWKPSLVMWFIYALMVSVLLTLAFDRLRHGEPAAWTAPIASAIAGGLEGLSGRAGDIFFFSAWWAHLLILLSFLVYVPQSKHFHIITAPFNILLKSSDPPGRLDSLDLEDDAAESFGVGEIEAFKQKQLLDLYACVECGRCTNVCPASGTGKLLSPMHLMTKLRDHLTEKGAAVTSTSPWVPNFAGSGGAHAMSEAALEVSAVLASGAPTDISPTMEAQRRSWQADTARDPKEVALIGEVMTEEELWACTTCRNCEDQCPVGNSHVDKIIDMRRYLVLMEGRMPHDGQRAMQNIERQGNPWGISRNDRANWIAEIAPQPEQDELSAAELPHGEDGAELNAIAAAACAAESASLLRVPTVKEKPDFELLFFVGSMGSYDNRSKKVTRALVKLMNEAGVRFAVLGNEEKSSGDTARRMGNEMLFQQLAAENIAAIKKYAVTRIVTVCPHTYNTLKNEYPDFGLPPGVKVQHHTELLAELVRAGRLWPRHRVAARAVYHDSCYLGRYNGVYDPPRELLQAIQGLELAEMERSRENGMCCGAGGGRMWMEETEGKRVNLARTEQALATLPQVIVSACPYCLTMIEDGTKLKEADGTVQARDVAELLEMAVFGGVNMVPAGWDRVTGADARRKRSDEL